MHNYGSPFYHLLILDITHVCTPVTVRQQDVHWLQVRAWHDHSYIAGISLLAHSLTVKLSPCPCIHSSPAGRIATYMSVGIPNAICYLLRPAPGWFSIFLVTFKVMGVVLLLMHNYGSPFYHLLILDITRVWAGFPPFFHTASNKKIGIGANVSVCFVHANIALRDKFFT